jgi:hypothetical protein
MSDASIVQPRLHRHPAAALATLLLLSSLALFLAVGVRSADGLLDSETCNSGLWIPAEGSVLSWALSDYRQAVECLGGDTPNDASVTHSWLVTLNVVALACAAAMLIFDNRLVRLVLRVASLGLAATFGLYAVADSPVATTALATGGALIAAVQLPRRRASA